MTEELLQHDKSHFMGQHHKIRMKLKWNQFCEFFIPIQCQWVSSWKEWFIKRTSYSYISCL